MSADPDARSVLLVTHPSREQANETARRTAGQLLAAGVEVRVLETEEAGLGVEGVVPVAPVQGAAKGCELVVVVGGDGTLLRGAEMARGTGAALLGINLGHFGFLAEAEPEDLNAVVERLIARDYTVEERMTLDIVVLRDGSEHLRTWAVNEASVEKRSRERLIELVVEVDGRPLSRWGCDGVVCATPTGSTAYAFSAGGPVVWPEVQALLMVPLSAHALFARPLVVAPTSVLAVELAPGAAPGVLWCDGRRASDLEPGDRVESRRSNEPLRLARIHRKPFTDRLVRKFDLPVTGWRGRSGRP